MSSLLLQHQSHHRQHQPQQEQYKRRSAVQDQERQNSMEAYDKNPLYTTACSLDTKF